MAKEGKLKRKIESFLIAVQTNAKRTNCLVSLFNGISSFAGYLMPML